MKKLIISVLAVLSLSGVSIQAYSQGDGLWHVVRTNNPDAKNLTDTTEKGLCEKIFNVYKSKPYGVGFGSYEIIDFYAPDKNRKTAKNEQNCFIQQSNRPANTRWAGDSYMMEQQL